jgi:hypothetical protein
MKGSLLVEESTFSAAFGRFFDPYFKRNARTLHTGATNALKFGCNRTVVTTCPNTLPSHDSYSTFRIINLPLCNMWSVYCSKEIRRAVRKTAT